MEGHQSPEGTNQQSLEQLLAELFAEDNDLRRSHGSFSEENSACTSESDESDRQSFGIYSDEGSEYSYDAEGDEWCSLYNDDESSYDDYIHDCIQHEIDQEIERQMDEQFEKEQQKVNDMLQKQFDEVIQRESRIFEDDRWYRMLESKLESESDLLTTGDVGINVDDVGGMLQYLNLSKDADTGVTVGDIEIAIQNAIKKSIGIDEDPA